MPFNVATFQVTLKEVLSMTLPQRILPEALKRAARAPTNDKKWSSLIKVWPKVLYMEVV